MVEIFLWLVIIFLLGIIGCLSYKHLELLKMFHSLKNYNPTEAKTTVSLHKFPFSPTNSNSTSTSSITSPPVQFVEVETGPFHSYYVEYFLFFMGVTAIAVAAIRDVCRRKNRE